MLKTIQLAGLPVTGIKLESLINSFLTELYNFLLSLVLG